MNLPMSRIGTAEDDMGDILFTLDEAMSKFINTQRSTLSNKLFNYAQNL